MSPVNPRRTAAVGDNFFQSNESTPSRTVDQLLRGVVQANRQLLTASHLHVAVPEVLSFLGEAAGVDRAYVYKNHTHPDTGKLAMSLRFKWTRDGIPSSLESTWQNLPYAEHGLTRWLEAFSAGQTITGNLSDFPEAERQLLAAEHVCAILMVPVFVESQLWGYIGFDTCQGDRTWTEPEQAIVQAAADSLGGAIARQQYIEALRARELQFQKLSANVPGMLFQAKQNPAGDLAFTYVSGACADITGLPPHDIDRLFTFIPPEAAARLQDSLRHSAETLTPFQAEWSMPKPNGSSKWLQCTARPERQPDGTVLWSGVLIDISDRKQAKVEQQAQAQFLESIWDGVDYGIFVLDVLDNGEEFRFAHYNPTMDRISPIPMATLVGTTLAESMPIDIADLYRQRYRACVKSGQSIEFEERFEVDGEQTQWMLTLTPLRNAQQAVHRIVVTATNITHRKAAEMELLRIRKAIESASDGIGIVDNNWQVVYHNPAMDAMFGLTPEDFNALGDPAKVYRNPEILQEIGQAVEAGQSWRGEVVMRHASGNWIDVDLRVDLIKDAKSQTLGFIGTYTNITEKKQSEERLSRANAILQAQQEAIRDGILVLDEHARIAFYNRRFCELWNVSETWISKRDQKAVFSHLSHQLAYPDELMVAMQNGTVEPGSSNRAEVWLKDGRVFDRFSAPVRSPDGDNLGRIWYFEDITDRKQTETRIQESYTLLNSVINGTKDLIFVKNISGQYTLVNRAMLSAFGREADFILGQDDRALYPPEIAHRIQLLDQELLDNGQSYTFEQTVPMHGELRTFLTSKTPYRDAEGTILGLIGISRDVTEIKQAEAQLQASHTLLNSVINGTTDVIFAKDRQGRYTLVNDAMLETFGMTRDRLIGHTDDEVFPPEVAANIAEVDRQVLKSQRSHTFEEIIPINGESRQFLTNRSPCRDSDGNVLGLIGIARDVTQIKQAEVQLHESYTLLNSVINGTTDIIFVKDLDGKYRLVNTAFADRFGLTPEEIIGKEDADLYPEEVADQLIANEQFVLSSKQLQHFEEQVPIGDEIRVYLTKKTPQFDGEGNVTGVICISRDVTEIQRIQEERDRYFLLSSDMVCIAGFDGYLKRINPAFTRILGYTEAELLAVPFLEFIHPEDREASANVAAQVMDGVPLYYFENRWRCKDGSYRWFSWSSTPYAEQNILYATARDITDRKATEASLQASERRFRDVTEAAGEYVWEIDVDGNYIFLTDQVLTVKGHAPQDLLGRSLFTAMHEDDVEPVQAILREASLQRQSFRLECRSITATGELVWEELSGLPMLDAQDRLVGFRGTGLSITEKQQAEAELRRFKQALESSSDAICISDADTIHRYQNRAFSELLGFPDANTFRQEMGTIFNAYADPHVAQFVASKIAQDGHYTGEVMLRSSTGRLIPALLRANAILDEAGNTIGTIRAYTDISDRKAAEAQLQMQEQFLRSIYDGSAHRIFAINVLPDGDVVYSSHNRAAEIATGRSSQSVDGLTPEALFGPEEGAAIRAICQRCIETGESITKEEHITLNGVPSWVLTNFNPLRDVTGKVHRIIGTSFDISAIKAAEHRLKQQAKLSAFRAEIDSLLTRGESLQHMLQSCCEVIVKYMDAAFARIWTANLSEQVLELQASAGLYRHINGGHARVPIGQLKIGLIAAEKTPYLSNDIVNDPRLGDRAWAEREGMVAFAGYPLIVDDQLLGVVALFACHPLPDESLEILGLVADEIALGLKRKQAEMQLQVSETRLRQQATELQATLQELQRAQTHLIQSEKMSSLGQLVAGVAHEINNPVSFIYGNLSHARNYIRDLLHLVDLYQTHYPTPHPEIQGEIEAVDLPFVMEDLPKLLNSMKVGAERIQGIVSSLRTFSRMDESDMKAVNLHDGIDSTLVILQNRIRSYSESGGIEIVRDYGDLPLVECYAGQLNQVFMNVISNAIDALEERDTSLLGEDYQPQIRIHTMLTADQRVEIVIQDNGPGIPPAARDRLFDPFYTTKPIGKGTGMGLSISYQIVTERHGGTLTCDSTVGVGTTFTITIPLRQS
ncbi:MAG: PAS domain-containing protein [Leptolyngbyaceae cyanobacterium T60_A2020_046]|nr:PAS domain-containing protein [Leptolyngbyaceae cyanobacterium T60_A2020_046]